MNNIISSAWHWLTKYSVLISLLQAIAWPIGIAITTQQNWHDVTITAEQAFVNDVVTTWFFNDQLYGYRSLDECEYFHSGDDSFVLYSDIEPCDQFPPADTEYEIIFRAALEHGFFDYMNDSELLDMIRFELYANVDETDLCCSDWQTHKYPESVRNLLSQGAD